MNTVNIEDRDLWWEARRQSVEEIEVDPEVTYGMLSFAIEEKRAIVADLNLYRPGVNLKALIDRGVTHFILRIGGPRSWVEGNWRYEEDPTYRVYWNELKKLGIDPTKQVIGYVIHNAFEDFRLARTVHTDLINQWTSGGYMPAAIVFDHEVAKCWRNGAEITCTPPNLVDSLKANTAQAWNVFRKPIGIYTARWFINSYGYAQHEAYFDQVNRPEAGKQRPMWYAWVPQSSLGSTVWEQAEDCTNKLLIPTGDQTGKYLQCGSYSVYDLWQFLFSFRTPEMVGANQPGIDISISRGTVAEFEAAFGLTAGSAPDPEPDPEPDPDTTLAAKVALLERDLAALKAVYLKHTHGEPV